MRPALLLLAAALITGILVAGALLVTQPAPSPRPMVYMIYDMGKGDESYADSAYRGLFAAQENLPFTKREFRALESAALAGLVNNATGPERPGLVITLGYRYAGVTQDLARDHPEIRFLGIDQAGTGPANLQNFEITSYGESYLAGVLAATATKTGRTGIILGTRSDLLEGFRKGYTDGVHAVNPQMQVDQAYVRENSTAGFADPGRAAFLARQMYRDGADIIYLVAGYSNTGAIAEAKAAPGRYVIGVDSDQTHLGPSVVLASAVKRIDRVVYRSIGAFLNGTFTGGQTIAGLREGVTGLVFNPDFAFYNGTVSGWMERAMEEEARYLESRG